MVEGATPPARGSFDVRARPFAGSQAAFSPPRRPMEEMHLSRMGPIQPQLDQNSHDD
jgi:hypothetical protein